MARIVKWNEDAGTMNMIFGLFEYWRIESVRVGESPQDVGNSTFAVC